jgi:hypothetical protein
MKKQFVLEEKEVDELYVDFDRIISITWKLERGELSAKEAATTIRAIAGCSQSTIDKRS